MLSSKGIDFLREVVKNKLKLEDYEVAIKRKERENEDRRKKLTMHQANVEHEIKKSIASTRRNIENMFDSKTDDIEKDIKAEKDRRSKSKNEQMNKRIEEANADLILENTSLNEYINSLAKRHNVSMRSNSKLYFMFLIPRGMKENVGAGAIIFVLLSFALLGVNFFAADTSRWFWLIAVSAIFSVIYVIKSYYSVKNMKYLEESRKIYDKIAKNERGMSINANRIKSDNDESFYDLAEFDTRLRELENNLDSVLKQKESKLEDFDSNEAPKIEEDIKESNIEKIAESKAEIQKYEKELDELKEYKERLIRYIVINYDNVLGDEFKDIKTINKLIKIIEEGKANTVEEAIAEYYEED